jgi:hypothetical protein
MATGINDIDRFAGAYTVRRPNEDDHVRVLQVMDEWWSRPRCDSRGGC